jgi:hypothetical protein
VVVLALCINHIAAAVCPAESRWADSSSSACHPPPTDDDVDEETVAAGTATQTAASLLQRLSQRRTVIGQSLNEEVGPHHHQTEVTGVTISDALSEDAEEAMMVDMWHQRQQMRRALAERGLSLQEHRMPDSAEESCGWRPPTQCVARFQYGDTNFSGCASSGGLRPWCSHNHTYTGLWSGCKFGCGGEGTLDIGSLEEAETWGGTGSMVTTGKPSWLW